MTLFVAAAMAGYASSIDSCRHEYARHQVWREVRRIEDALRSGTGFRYWLYVEGEDSPTTDPREHARHQAILRDFERLAHLEGLSFADLQVDVEAAEAVARFRVNGRARGVLGARVEQPVPVRGQLAFQRTSAGWQLVGTRLVPGGDAPASTWKGEPTP